MPPERPYAEVIGDPIAQTKSPLIHGHWLKQLGIEADYGATRVPFQDVATFLASRRSDRNWRGCNVTIPHKEAVLSHLDRLDESAASVGAANCIVPRPDGLVGYNTDVEGIAAALDNTPLEGRKAVVIGAGGAARAAVAYLSRRHTDEITLLVRDPNKAQSLATMLPDKLVVGHLEDLSPLENAQVIINASPLGMTGCPEMPPALLEALANQPTATLFDMVYSPLRTPFLSAARGPSVDGLTMLVGQAAKAFELFFGQHPPAADAQLRTLLTRE